MGFASHAARTIKANRALLKKRRSYGEIREAYEGYVSDQNLQFKELTPLEQKRIRDKIIYQAKKDKIQTIKVYASISIFLTVLLLSIYLSYFDEINSAFNFHL
ncbi:hypothetical protein [Flagellimonas sp.]|uniref:hypothetical protein n=1 Tax=Flagellimonas sp. TaxID=2058762 RepID=UPI003F4A34AF